MNNYLRLLIGDALSNEICELEGESISHIFKLYVHILPTEISKLNNEMYYVGKTKCTLRRRFGNNGVGYKGTTFYSAIIKYGWDNFYHECISFRLSERDANTLEQKLIAYLHSNKRMYGYNDAPGGTGGNVRPTTHVCQYDIGGKLINVFDSAADAGRAVNIDRTRITNVCRHGGSAAGYIWSYEGAQPRTKRLYKKVVQKTIDGDIIAVYSCVNDASKRTGLKPSNIYKCISDTATRKTAGGCCWEYRK